ncbi:MAG: M48 family metallopeptidase [Clostridiales bacterium]|nr:M48 family metallopeptidase [Clostridiales bacterium]
MISARFIIVFMACVSLAFTLVKMRLADLQRKQPLPDEVADIYDPERYQKYLNYVADNRRIGLIFTAVNLILTVVLYYSSVFSRIETFAGRNPYGVFIATFALFFLIETVVGIIGKYLDTFYIREKYGMNKQTMKGFVKDTVLDSVQNLVLTGSLGLIFVFIGEHLPVWTHGQPIGLGKAFLFGLAIAAAVAAFMLLAALFSLWVLKKQYTFTPMPDDALRSKIMALQEGSKKKVSLIYIYDESKKTTTKNAFLLKLLWHREFGIADNFINENAETELLAVLSHEIGHLKHKKNLLNYTGYAAIGAFFCLFVWLIYKPDVILSMNAWIRESFGITVTNYYVWISVMGAILTPVARVFTTFGNYRSRQEEHEADREAVKNGYGEELIATFKRLSNDELINVNPHPVIEFLEYDHPGMYQRIRAIREYEAMRKA